MSSDYSRLYREAQRELAPNRVARAWVSPAGRAGLVMAAVVALLWVMEILDTLTLHALDRLALDPRVPASLPEVFTAPLVHFGFGHLVANTVPLFVLGFLVALRGVGRFALVSLVIVAVGGVLTWAMESAGLVGGASGVVFGYFGFLVARGIFDRRLVDILIGVAVFLFYGGMLWGILPTQPFISWKGHLFGLVAGVLAAWWLRRGRTPANPGQLPTRYRV
jgi:membrane associated rhomboid family serine protease